MLYKEAVDESALGLLRSLQSKQYLRGFNLAGGTALSLLNGYRKSVDIDLFSNFAFDSQQMLENLVQDYDFDLLFSGKYPIFTENPKSWKRKLTPTSTKSEILNAYNNLVKKIQRGIKTGKS